uniref:UDP-N-acetylglucosamine transferase subunit ALG13 n=1 Tax=Candidatus Kentrum sp. UNK TaxID=2126344 RepID=A0A451AWK1_9GAMM|nr:MAG: UDP-N-acetylglucosamine transferase subunit ALG13 [Candidatus Kentron sp. UNK]VFK70426.1 MAG: UDP-N-acetylglucosamine transferase subunit ALG13 [Candidatus Kentron sp. UNK]
MIFVTVGTQLSFDRLVGTIDEWAEARPEKPKIFAQTGKTSRRFVHLTNKPFLGHAEFQEKLTAADLVIAHAGMGSIISALQVAKPILVMPRCAALGEHRNNHQMDTAERLAEMGYVNVAFDKHQLRIWLNNYRGITSLKTISSTAQPILLDTIREFLDP